MHWNFLKRMQATVSRSATSRRHDSRLGLGYRPLACELLEARRLLSIGVGPLPAEPEFATVEVGGAQARANKIIVYLADDITPVAAWSAVSMPSGTVTGELTDSNAVVVELNHNDLLEAASEWSAHPSVLYAEPIYLSYPSGTFPNDPEFPYVDSEHSGQWGLHNTGGGSATVDVDIDAPEAWDFATGSTDVVIAMIDTGVNMAHEDLYLNIWLNQGEIPLSLRPVTPHVSGHLRDSDGDGLITFRDLNHSLNEDVVEDLDTNGNDNGYVDAEDLLADTGGSSHWVNSADEDGNTYYDDLVGWDFTGFTDPTPSVHPDNDPTDSRNHGTKVAGVMGAMTNNEIGVAGVAWNAQIMVLKYFPPGGEGAPVADGVECLEYITMMKTEHNVNVVVVNNSYGRYGDPIDAQRNAIKASIDAGIMFVASAGNGVPDDFGVPVGVDTDFQVDPDDDWIHYPSCYEFDPVADGVPDAVISVAATTSTDWKASFSNYGRYSVDLGAPGQDIVSTSGPSNGYDQEASGTSFAAPLTSGVVALMMDRDPTLTLTEVKEAILDHVDPVARFAHDDRYPMVSEGRLNLLDALGFFVIGSDPAEDEVVVDSSLPDTFKIFLSDVLDTEYGFDEEALTVNGIEADDAEWDEEEYMLEFEFSQAPAPTPAEGDWTMSIAADTLYRASDDEPLDAWEAVFHYELPPEPMVISSKDPSGSLIYEATSSGVIDYGQDDEIHLSTGDVDSFTIDLDVPQTITVVVVPDPALELTVELFGPGSSTVPIRSVSTGAGIEVLFQAVDTTVAGTYTVEVSGGYGETTGPFTVQLILNAVVEEEEHGGDDNGRDSWAEDLYFADLSSGSGQHAAVLGALSGSVDEDWYSFELADGESATLALEAASGLTLELHDDETGWSTSGETADNLDQVIANFVDATTEGDDNTYFAVITGDNAGDYSLIVTRSADFDRESDNNFLATAQDITPNGVALGHVGGEGDTADYYSFQVNAGDALEVVTSTPADGVYDFDNDLNPEIKLYDPNGTEVHSDTDSAAGDNAQLSHTAVATGTYVVCVLAESSTEGEYVLDVSGFTRVPIFLDDGSDGFSRTGTWTPAAVGYLDDSRSAPTGNGSVTATWTFDVTPGYMYQVAATWVEDVGNAALAGYKFTDDEIGTDDNYWYRWENQTRAPDDFTDGGVGWEILDTSTNTSGTLIVELSDNTASGAVVADAIRVVRVGPGATFIDNGDPDWDEAGPNSWTEYNYETAGFDQGVHYRTAGIGTNTATWTFDVTPGREYEVAATWWPGGDRGTDVQYTIRDDPYEWILPVVNQQIPPSEFNDQGEDWRILRTFTMTGDTLEVEVSDDADGIVIADAIRIIDRTEDPLVQITESDDSTLVSEWDPANTYDTYDVVLTEAPTADVTVNFISDSQIEVIDDATGTVTYLTFTTSNWDTAQTVLVTAEEDALEEGSHASVIAHTASSSDTNYNGIGIASVNALITDDDTTVQVIDDGDPAFYDQQGAGWRVAHHGGGYEGDARWSYGDDGYDTATWTFKVQPGYLYDVSATWVEYGNRATNAPYTITAGANTITPTADQQVAPDDFTYESLDFETLGQIGVPAGTHVLTVKLTDLANGVVIADVIHLSREGVYSPPPPEAPPAGDPAALSDLDLELARWIVASQSSDSAADGASEDDELTAADYLFKLIGTD